MASYLGQMQSYYFVRYKCFKDKFNCAISNGKKGPKKKKQFTISNTQSLPVVSTTGICSRWLVPVSYLLLNCLNSTPVVFCNENQYSSTISMLFKVSGGLMTWHDFLKLSTLSLVDNGQVSIDKGVDCT